MDHATSTLIDLAEAAYDLEVRDAEWLPRVVSAGLTLLDHGLGVAGGIYTRSRDGGEVTLDHFCVAGGPDECMRRLARVAIEIQQTCAHPGICTTLSEAAGDEYARAVATWSGDPCARDALGLWAVHDDGHGAFVIAPLLERTTLSSRMRCRWRMVASHLTSGFRLRRALEKLDDDGSSTSRLPYKDFEAAGAMRDTAVVVDRVHGRTHSGHEAIALELWKDLVAGRWSLLDWFESDGRRYVLAIRNAPGVRDPHRLTTREAQVATHAAAGESGKIIGRNLGISTSRVSRLLHDAKRKLRVSTQAELVNMVRSFRVV